MIERVEIYKGIIPAWLCGDGLGGAINIVTRQHFKNLEASYEIGSYNTHKGSLLTHKNFEDSGISLSAGGFFKYSDNDYKFNSPFNEGLVITRDHDAYREYNFNMDVGFTKLWFDKFNLGLSYNNLFQEIQGGLVYEQGNVQHAHTKERSFQTSQNLYKQLANNNLSFSLSSVIGYTVFNQIDTSYYRYNFDGTSYLSPSVQGEVGELPNDSRDTRLDISELLSINYNVSNNSNIKWNTVFKYSEKTPEDNLADTYAQYATSGYKSSLSSIVSGISYEIKLFDNKLTNSLGAKYFHHSSEVVPTSEKTSLQSLIISTNESSNFGWNEAIAWKPFDRQITFKVSAQQSVRIPTADELFGDMVMIYPSTHLRPEKSLNFNLGVDWLVNTLGYPNLRLDVNTYYMKVDDMINLMAAVMKLGYQNIDEVEIKGAELDLKSELTSWCSFSGNFAYNDARNIMKYTPGTTVDNPKYNLRVPNAPYLFGNATIKLHKKDFILRNTNSVFFCESQFTEKYYYNWKVSDNQSLDIPRSLSFNAGIRQIFFKNNLQFNFEVHNFTDEEIWGQFQYPLPGRTFHLKIKYLL
jgi:outer membrane receptor protein involved in Fe transport